MSLRALTRQIANARIAIIQAKFNGPLTDAETTALAALDAYMRMATASLPTGLLRAAETLRDERRMMRKIDRLLRPMRKPKPARRSDGGTGTPHRCSPECRGESHDAIPGAKGE